MKVLECSTFKGDKDTPKGDTRFSALVARVKVNDVWDTIENHYQMSKRFIGKDRGVLIPRDWKDVKGRKDVAYFELEGRRFEPKYLSAFYALMWAKYLDSKPGLVEYAKGFDAFTDKFRGSSVNCQADIIGKYVQQGRDAILGEPLVKEFIDILKAPHKVSQVEGNLLYGDVDIIAHQTNCKGVMGAGIAKSIKEEYPAVFRAYESLCKKEGKKLLGVCQAVNGTGLEVTTESEWVPKKVKTVANLFGQDGYGFGFSFKRQTDYDSLEKALQELKTIAQTHNLRVGVPYKLGCGLAGGDWDIVEDMLKRVFTDYPVTVYKLPE